ncbi:MAG: hypothetical protein NTX45_07020 [Proteobacteria bacterium]|nr:hypothetical protein [Pseudomonadota bacterium]
MSTAQSVSHPLLALNLSHLKLNPATGQFFHGQRRAGFQPAKAARMPPYAF